MKKTPYMIFIALIVSLISSGINAEEKRLRITTHEMKPFHYMEDGKITGLYTEMIEIVLKKINVEYSIEMYPMIREDKIVFLDEAKLNIYYPSNLMFSKKTMSGRQDIIKNFSLALREFKKTEQFRKLCKKYFKKELPDVNVWGP